MSAYCAPQELHDLAFRYAQAVDRRDADKLLSVFTDDGAVMGFGENPISFRGEAGLRDMTEKLNDEGAGALVGGQKLPDYKP